MRKGPAKRRRRQSRRIISGGPLRSSSRPASSEGPFVPEPARPALCSPSEGCFAQGVSEPARVILHRDWSYLCTGLHGEMSDGPLEGFWKVLERAGRLVVLEEAPLENPAVRLFKRFSRLWA